MRLTDRLFSVFFLIVLGALGYQTSLFEDLPYESYSSKMFPYLVIGFCLILVAVLFVSSFLANKELPTAREVWGRFASKRRMSFLLAIILYLALMKAIGFVISTSLFLMVTILGLSEKPQKDFPKAVAITFCVVGGVVLLVEHFLQAFLP